MQTKKMIGIIGAMSIETQGLKAAMTDKREETVSGIRFTVGKLENTPCVTATCGVGKVAAALCAEAMILRFGVTALLNTGVAGGLAEGMVVTDIAVATDVVQHDMDTTAIGDPAGLISGLNIVHIPTDQALSDRLAQIAKQAGTVYTGTIASGDLFVAKEADKKRIKKMFGAIACEMEGAAIGQVAYTNKTPFAVLRVISDGGDGMEFSEFAPKAAERSVAITKAFVAAL
ncbi:MAG: 5'-methylthioadenosine/adenosylhomocysteine nucleosidase [Ruminococcaceae bacterium]|nr:5'-methylthioadenosine/adenosylhomocysteine nucleosidase [Oscillospiraceae bacterium]